MSASDVGLNLAGLGLIATGGILAYSGVNDPVGGPVGVFRDLISGKTPTPGVRKFTGLSGLDSDADTALGKSRPREPVDDQHGGLVLGAGSRVVAVAERYKGVKYTLGGASMRGIDCSGLVMVAYREGAGISLPHKATVQAAFGRLVPRGQAQAGDLVAWGVPGNYPHIAIVVNGSTCIAAWTFGVPCGEGPIDQKAVPGFGLPDIIRVLGT